METVLIGLAKRTALVVFYTGLLGSAAAVIILGLGHIIFAESFTFNQELKGFSDEPLIYLFCILQIICSFFASSIATRINSSFPKHPNKKEIIMMIAYGISLSCVIWFMNFIPTSIIYAIISPAYIFYLGFDRDVEKVFEVD